MVKRYILILFSFFCLGLNAQILNSDELYEKAEEFRDSSFILADSLINKAIENFKSNTKEKSKYNLGALHYFAAKINAEVGFFEEAEIHFKVAIAEVEKEKEKDTSKLAAYYMRMAENSMDKNEQDKSIVYGLEAIDLAEKINDTLLLGDLMAGLAEIYRLSRNDNLSLKYNRIALQLLRKKGGANSLARVYNNLSTVLGKMGNNHEAIDSLKKALTFLNEEHYFGKAKLNSNIAYCYRNLGLYDSALFYNRVSIKYKKLANDEIGLSYSLDAIGRAYLGLGNLDSAESYVLRAREIAVRFKKMYKIKDITEHLVDVYAAKKDFEKAYLYMDTVMFYDDSIYNEEIRESAELYQRKYDLNKKEQEIAKLKSEQKISEAEQKSFWWMFVSVLAVLLFITSYIFMLFKRKEQANKMIELDFQNSQKENERNKAELNHFAKDLMLKNKQLIHLSKQLEENKLELEKLEAKKSERIDKLSDIKILTKEDWTRFKNLFDKVYPHFFEKLNRSEYNFTKGEKRLMALTKLNMDTQELADTLGISAESVTKSRFRLKKKLNLTSGDLDHFIHQL